MPPPGPRRFTVWLCHSLGTPILIRVVGNVHPSYQRRLRARDPATWQHCVRWLCERRQHVLNLEP